jgi:purine-binding chemotaxis protein CheW
MSSQQFTTFLVGDQLFGIEVESVQEIIRYQPMTPVPLSSPAVAGLINLRGEVIPAVDVRQRLAPWSRGAVEEPVNVVVRTDHGPVSLLVDQIGAVVDARDDDFEPPPETLIGPARALIRGAYKLDTELLLALDVAGVVTIPPHLDGLTRPSPPSTKGTAGHG